MIPALGIVALHDVSLLKDQSIPPFVLPMPLTKQDRHLEYSYVTTHTHAHASYPCVHLQTCTHYLAQFSYCRYQTRYRADVRNTSLCSIDYYIFPFCCIKKRKSYVPKPLKTITFDHKGRILQYWHTVP